MTHGCGSKRDKSGTMPRIFRVAAWTRELMQLQPETGNKFAYRAAAAGYTPTAIRSPPSPTSVPAPDISRPKKSDRLHFPTSLAAKGRCKTQFWMGLEKMSA